MQYQKNYNDFLSFATTGLSPGSRKSPSTMVDHMIKAIRDDLKSLLRETKKRPYAKRRGDLTRDGDETIRATKTRRYVRRRRDDTRYED